MHPVSSATQCELNKFPFENVLFAVQYTNVALGATLKYAEWFRGVSTSTPPRWTFTCCLVHCMARLKIWITNASGTTCIEGIQQDSPSSMGTAEDLTACPPMVLHDQIWKFRASMHIFELSHFYFTVVGYSIDLIYTTNPY